MGNFILSIIVLAVVSVVLALWLMRQKDDVIVIENRMDDNSIIEYLNVSLEDSLTSSLYEGSPSMEEYERRKERRKQLRSALEVCMVGDRSAKKYVKLYIKDKLLTYGVDNSNINDIINFNHPERMSDQDIWEILLYHFMRTHNENAARELIKKYGMDELKEYPDGSKGFKITSEEVRSAYFAEKIKLSFDDKLNIVTQRIYQQFKGLGVIDDLRDQNIDGVNGGNSGVPDEVRNAMKMGSYIEGMREIPRASDSVWIFFQGKPIHLEFLSFGSEEELIRICQNIYSFGNPGQINEAQAYKIHDMADGSRIVVFRPPFSESWAFYCRMFDDSLIHLDQIVIGENSEMTRKLLKYIVSGEVTMAVTGAQGAGKTKLLLALIGFINRIHNIRISETMFELRARKVYPNRNLMSVRENATISGQEGLDVLKKSDGGITILGEVATHPVASQAMQLTQTGSLATYFSHHANTVRKLVESFTNSLVASGAIPDPSIAAKQVVENLRMNTHVVKNPHTGKRNIQRISEIVPLADGFIYPEVPEGSDLLGKVNYALGIVKTYFQRMTDKQLFEERHIIVWNDEKERYEAKDELSEGTIKHIRSRLTKEEADEFDQFLLFYWGQEVEDEE